jgi:hypothetical protein
MRRSGLETLLTAPSVCISQPVGWAKLYPLLFPAPSRVVSLSTNVDGAGSLGPSEAIQMPTPAAAITASPTATTLPSENRKSPRAPLVVISPAVIEPIPPCRDGDGDVGRRGRHRERSG